MDEQDYLDQTMEVIPPYRKYPASNHPYEPRYDVSNYTPAPKDLGEEIAASRAAYKRIKTLTGEDRIDITYLGYGSFGSLKPASEVQIPVDCHHCHRRIVRGLRFFVNDLVTKASYLLYSCTQVDACDSFALGQDFQKAVAT